MAYDLARMTKAQGVRRKSITLRPINPASAFTNDLATIYAPSWRVWREAVPAIMGTYDVVPIADGLTVDSPAQTEQVMNAAAAEFIRVLVATVTPSLRRWAVLVEQWHRNKWIDAVKAGTGIDLATLLFGSGEPETVETFIARNVALVKNVSDQAQARISDAVWRGYQQRLPARDVAKEISGAVEMGRSRAIRIASDQNAKLCAALDRDRQVEAGLEQYRWRHSGKLHPRVDHKARDGKLFDLGRPIGDQPGDLPFCGCRAQAYIPLMDEI